MVMGKWAGVAGGLMLALASSQAVATQASETQVKELMQVFGVERMFTQMNSQMAGMMSQQLPCVPASYWNNFLDQKSVEELTARMVPVYQRHFSAEDIQGLLAFYRSPLGKKVIAEMPATMAEGMQIGQQWGRVRGQAMMAELQKNGTVDAKGQCPAGAGKPSLSPSAAGAK